MYMLLLVYSKSIFLYIILNKCMLKYYNYNLKGMNIFTIYLPLKQILIEIEIEI